MKVLQVIDQAFRTTTEEQDDTIIWLTRSMRSAGGELMLLLSGHGVHYAVQRRRQPALALGAWHQTEPAEITRDLAGLVDSGVPVYAVEEDLADRGLAHLPLQNGVRGISRQGLATLYDSADQIWHW
ncbi:MAG: hypothetical protein WC247_09655 [Porticoccaceae bacterium]